MQVMTTMTDVSLNHAMFSQKHQVRGAMEIALFIQNIQEERAEVALFIFINQVPRFLVFLLQTFFRSRQTRLTSRATTWAWQAAAGAKEVLGTAGISRWTESFARKMFFLAGEVPEDGPSSRGGAHLAQCRTIVHTWHLSIFLHSRFLSHGNFTLKKCVNLCQNSLTTKHRV